MEATTFIKTNLEFAKEAERVYGVPYLVALAQSALESGWGAKATGNNLFGIRADRSWTGPVVSISTHEVVKGERVFQKGQYFRAYPSTRESFLDWGKFLTRNPRYRGAFFHKENPEQFARAIAEAGYSTTPNYGDTLVAVIQSVKKRIA